MSHWTVVLKEKKVHHCNQNISICYICLSRYSKETYQTMPYLRDIRGKCCRVEVEKVEKDEWTKKARQEFVRDHYLNSFLVWNYGFIFALNEIIVPFLLRSMKMLI